MRLRILSAFALALLLSAAGLVPACGDPEPARVEVTVVVVLAHDRDEKVAPKLDCLAKEIRKNNPKLTGFRLGQVTCKSVPLDGSETFPLADGREAAVHVKRCGERPERFCLEVKSPSLVGAITYSAACGKYMPFDTGCVTKKDKDRIFLAVMVEACKKKTK